MGAGRPLAASAPQSAKIQYIKDLCQRHRGEVREIKGEWMEVDSPFPEHETRRRFDEGENSWTCLTVITCVCVCVSPVRVIW